MITPATAKDLDAPSLYLDLLKQCLTRTLTPETLRPAALDPFVRSHPLYRAFCATLRPVLRALDLELARPYRADRRAEGRDWPTEAETMIGLARLQNLQDCVTSVIRRGIPGDLLEAGVWRGGASIFMRAVLKAYGEEDRTVWVADSFEGLPKPDGRYSQDEGDRFWTYNDVLSVPLGEVRANFERYGLLDHQVRFLKGWFKDTLAAAPIERLAVLRLDGDMYSSTMDQLDALYSKLSIGGYAIVDDYYSVAVCREAVDDFRSRHKIQDPIQQIDWSGGYWEKR